jgi:hypothetical protein
MGSRERKREELRKRKARGPDPPAEALEEQGASSEQRITRSELKNQEAREKLEPLATGERPTVVTVGAVISGLIALSVIGAYIFGATVNGDRPHFAQVAAPTLLMGVMAVGMWRARYWAVLGFQVVLVFLILGSALGLLQAVNVAQGIGRSVVLLASGTMFYFMVKAMARIQMPDRSPRG